MKTTDNDPKATKVATTAPATVTVTETPKEAPADKPDLPEAVSDGEKGGDTGQPSPFVNDTKATLSTGSDVANPETPVAPAADLAAKGEKKILVSAKDASASPLVLTVNGQRLEVPLDKPVSLTDDFLEALVNAGVTYTEV